MRLVTAFHNYGKDTSGWALLFSLTTSNLAIQLGPLRFYLAFRPADWE